VSDREFQRDPTRAVIISSVLILGYVLVVPALYMPNLALLVLVSAIAQACIGASFVSFTAIVSAILPFKLRAQGFALMGLYLFVFGALLGAIITGSISDDHGYRTALTVVVPPPMILGALIMAWGSRFVRDDMSAVVAELEEERREVERVAAGGDVAAIQVRDLDFSYGSLQVLFDVSVDVHEGEVLALLGTNGAGKSTLLNCMTGLAMPDRGAVRFRGRTITYSDPVERVRSGIVLVPGGKAVFPSLTVEDNLLVGAYTHVWDDARRREGRDRVLELFPDLAQRLDQPAGSMSGGQQQMLAIAKGLLLDPKVLCIDELALGLAPVVVQQLLEVVAQLKAEGVTMVIVEQSVNVALSIADRAIFMEKGRVRFQGPARDLLERDDLVRAVFLGGGGG
jgi:ABC-type branched-subunit amino acid transport system ATPase component